LLSAPPMPGVQRIQHLARAKKLAPPCEASSALADRGHGPKSRSQETGNDLPLSGPTPPPAGGGAAAGCWRKIVVQASRQARCGSRGQRRWPASKPISKQRAPPRRTSLLASRSANSGGAFRSDGQGPRRPIPVHQPGRGPWLPKEPPRASTCQKTPLRRWSIRLHNPSRYRKIAGNARCSLACRSASSAETWPADPMAGGAALRRGHQRSLPRLRHLASKTTPLNVQNDRVQGSF
jgi:hypothetical protein